MKRQAKQMLWLDSARGIYIPRDFAQMFVDRDKSVTGVSAEDWEILECGPDHELYWDTWDDVLNNAVVTEADGTKYIVHQDGDCWLVEQGASWDETGEISETGWYMDDGEDEETAQHYKGLRAWAMDYQMIRKAGNVKDAEALRDKITAAIAEHNLDATRVWGDDPDDPKNGGNG